MPLPIPVSLNQPSNYMVFTLINRDNPGAKLSPYRVNLSAPTPTVGNLKRNTTLTVTAIEDGTPGRNYLGSTSITYNRLDLDAIFDNTAGVVVVEDPETSVDLLEPLNKAFRLQLTKDDIVKETISNNLYTLKAAPGSLAYIGEAIFEIVAPLSATDTELSEDLLVRELSGFNLSDGEPDSALPSRQSLLNLINTDNGKLYTLARVMFELPSTLVGNPDYNACIFIRGLEGFGYRGSVFILYNRVAIDDVVTSTVNLPVDENSPVTIRGMVGGSNILNGMSLRRDEVVDGIFDPLTANVVVFEINNRSEVWLPGSKLTLTVTRGGVDPEDPIFPDVPPGQYVLVDGGVVGIDNNTILQFGD